MGIFSRKKVDNALSTSGSKSIFWGGPSKAGAYVDEQTAMQTAAVIA